MKFNRLSYFAVMLVAVACQAADQPAATKPAGKPNPAYAELPDDPKLPRVLILGDSISIGYTAGVRERLEGVANVHRPHANCWDTARGIANLDKWLGDRKWDVIHFNFGLHDLKYVDDKDTITDVDKGKLVSTPEAYEEKLRTIVERLKKTGAKLVWARTTVVPAGTVGRVEHVEEKYNAVADKVMRENGIPMDDLHAVVEAHPDGQLSKNVHFTPAGYGLLADSVAASIRAALKE